MIKEIISFRNKKSIIDMQQFSNDWTMQIFAESSAGESLPITSEFELLLVNELGTYLIPSDYYDIQNGTIILWGNAEITQFSGLNELYLKHDCFVSYGAKMCVIDKAEECGEVDLLPEYECGGDIDLTEYRKSVDQDIIDNDLQSQINSINIDKADKSELVAINEHISENTEAIVDIDGRLTNLENQFTLLPDFEQFLTAEEDPIFNEWLSTFDFNQFVSKEASLLDDFKNLSLDPGYYYTNEETLNDTPDGNISNAELIVSPNLRTWIGVDKWNGVFIRSYIVDTASWNPWRQLLSTKDIEDITAQLADHETRISTLETKVEALENSSGGGGFNNVYFEDRNTEELAINNVNSPLTIARFSDVPTGVYVPTLSCFAKRTDSANTEKNITIYIYDGTFVQKSISYTANKDFDYCFSLPQIQFDRENNGDVTIKVNYSGASGEELLVSDVNATLTKVDDL